MADHVRDVVAADVLQELPEHRREDHARESDRAVAISSAVRKPEGGEEQQQVGGQREQDSAEQRAAPAVCAVT